MSSFPRTHIVCPPVVVIRNLYPLLAILGLPLHIPSKVLMKCGLGACQPGLEAMILFESEWSSWMTVPLFNSYYNTGWERLPHYSPSLPSDIFHHLKSFLKYGNAACNPLPLLAASAGQPATSLSSEIYSRVSNKN